MYNVFFGFEQAPFASRPDPAFFYRSQQHDASLRGLRFAVQARMGLVSLTGEEGTGKTAVLECLVDSLESDNIPCAFFRDSRISVNQFFQTIASDLDLQCQRTSAYTIFLALTQLMTQRARRGRTVALIVDDAHNLPANVLNEIIHIASQHDEKGKLIQTVFAGRPDLLPMLDALNLDGLKQRAIPNRTLHPFARQETTEYIEFRLARAGMPKQTVFSREAMDKIHDLSRGFAPAIHALCERLLLAAFSARSPVCTQEILDQVFHKPHGKASKIVEAIPTVVMAARIDDLTRPALLSEPQPAPMRTALLPLAFDAMPRSPRLLRVSTNEPLVELRLPVPQPVFPGYTSALRVVEFALGSTKPMRLLDGANADVVRYPSIASIPFTEILPCPPLARLQPAATIRWSRVPISPFRVAKDKPPSPRAIEDVQLDLGNLENPTKPAIARELTASHTPLPLASSVRLLPSECYVTPRTRFAGGPALAHPSSIPSALQPMPPLARLQPAGTIRWPRVSVMPFQMAKQDRTSPRAIEDVQLDLGNLENPTKPAIVGEPAASYSPLPLVSSVRPSPPPAATPRKTFLNVLLCLQTWRPVSKLQPVSPLRPSFLWLPTWYPPADTSTGAWKPFLSQRKWLLGLAITIFAALARYGAPPAMRATADAAHQSWRRAHQAVFDRAAVALDEDFRTGLNTWTNRGGVPPSWTSDAAGFVHPGALALYRPSLSLVDYQMQFVGTIDKKDLSWVVRAADFNNYYAIRLTVLKPGPMPAIGVTRYAVIHGKTQNRVMTPLVMRAQSDTVYHVQMDIRGDHFALSIQDQPVDSWSESKLRQGGIGFFSEHDAGSRISGVRVRGQYDMLGRLCALLIPSPISVDRY